MKDGLQTPNQSRLFDNRKQHEPALTGLCIIDLDMLDIFQKVNTQ